MSLISPCKKTRTSLSICPYVHGHPVMRKWNAFSSWTMPPTHTILGEAWSCLEFTESYLVTPKAERYKGLEINENKTVHPEQNTQLLGRQMLHPNHIHWEHGSFMHCKTVTLFSSLSNFFLATCTQAMGKPWDILVACTCNVEVQVFGQTVRALVQQSC